MSEQSIFKLKVQIQSQTYSYFNHQTNCVTNLQYFNFTEDVYGPCLDMNEIGRIHFSIFFNFFID